MLLINFQLLPKNQKKKILNVSKCLIEFGSVKPTNIPTCKARIATLASNSGSLAASLNAFAILAFLTRPMQTIATSSRFDFTQFLARLVQTDSLKLKNKLLND